MKRNGLYLAAGAGLVAMVLGTAPAWAQTAPSLGAAQSFAVLSGTTVTNTGSSIITGDLGVSPGSAVTGFPPGLVVSGTIHAADATSLAAENSVTTAYNDLASQACTQDLTGQDLGGLTLTPGVYCFNAAAAMTGTLTLNGQGNANAVFIFRIGSTLTTASGASVVLINGGSSCNIFWQVGSSATLGTSSTIQGNILALTSITATTGARVVGRTLARNGAVTLDTNTINPACAVGPVVCPTIALAPATLPTGRIGIAYSQTITATGGTAPYSFALTSGALPAGLTLTAAGLLSGTPTTLGASTFTIRGTDANGCFAQITYTVVIAAATCPVITLAPPTLPVGRLGVAYSQQITATGGTGPYAFTVLNGTLPAGLTLTPGGLLSGTPTTLGSTTVTIQGADANACPGVATYAIVIAPVSCPLITLAPATLPAGRLGAPYLQQLTATGGTGPYVFTVVAGALPPGLSLSSAGLLLGSPTALGTSTFTVQATDGTGCPGVITYTITIQAAVPTLPEAFVALLGLLLTAAGYFALRRQPRAD
jgi:hypothetical protein